MAYRGVRVLDIKEVLRLWLLGRRNKEIARLVGLDIKTVRRYVREAETHGLQRGGGPASLSEERFGQVMQILSLRPSRPRGESWERCEQHRELIKKLLSGGRVRLTKVLKLLRRQGVDVPYGTLYRFAREQLEFGRQAPTECRSRLPAAGHLSRRFPTSLNFFRSSVS